MKTKIATALSIAGVLTAGSAAALVNTQILDGGPTESGASKAVLPPASSVELTVPDVTVDTLVDTLAVETSGATSTGVAPPSSSSTTTTTTTTTVAPTAASDFLTAFNVGDAGVVTVDVVDGGLVLVSAEPKPGWRVTKAEDDSNDETEEFENDVEVEFVSATVRVEFEARFDGVRIVPTVESEAIAAPTSAGTAAPRTTVAGQRGDDDAFDDEHDDDAFDDEFDDDEFDDDDGFDDEYDDESHDEHDDGDQDESHEDESHEDEGEDEHRDDD